MVVPKLESKALERFEHRQQDPFQVFQFGNWRILCGLKVAFNSLPSSIGERSTGTLGPSLTRAIRSLGLIASDTRRSHRPM